ncbi:Uncharacterized peptidase SA1530 [uncultured Roseburia sp.]|uniref:M24 family metallopeptidase n=1 Tax=Brotonthovivens ammoniilytica TaxID=2981725 RepID=A0ABT2TJH7_9FIRM|nr:M24 family metallopeptidase [Brotonthovivens ammoniilytica]MCU6762367.1 M24 family metallopeptidase [Brotonthovivens ammoniilytica]SCI69555.1 Uncharacterized peptidase SA1530 [uncultured Roseburia sp.]
METEKKRNGLIHDMGYFAGNLFFSKQEIRRRHNLVRQRLKAAGADLLIAQLCFPSASMAVDPYITWLTGTSGYKSTMTAVLPVQGELILIPGAGMQSVSGNDCPYLAGTKDLLQEVLNGVKRIAYCGLGRMPLSFYQYLAEVLPGVELIDFCRELDVMKAVKSQEELEAVKHAVWIQDRLIEYGAEYLKPGLTQSEIWSRIISLLSELGADMSVMPKILMTSGKNKTVGSFPTVHPKTRAHLCFPEYRLQEDDWVHIIYETPGLGGYYSETGRIFYFQEPCMKARKVWKECVELIKFQAGSIRPGKTLHEIREEVNHYLKVRGAKTDENIFQIRGIGNLTTESPQLYDWDQMKLQPGMVLSLQPRYTKGDETSIILDTYVVGAPGEKACRLSKVPQELVVLS